MTTTLTEKRSQIIVWTLLALMPIIGMAIDLIAPSLPAIANGLQISSGLAKDVISIYLLGYALGNFFTGFLTDAVGRQKLLRFALAGFVLVSLMPVIFPHIIVLLAARLLQGIMMGAVAVLIRAILSDVLPPEKLVRYGTFVGTMWGIGPVIGPVIGGYLQFYFGWKAGFCFFALSTLIGLIAVFIIVPETCMQRHPLNVKNIKNNLIEVLSHRIFMSIVILTGLVYSLIITFNTSAPFLIQQELHYSPVFFGHIALYLGLTFLAATFFSRYLLKFYTVEQLYFFIINLFFLIAIAAVITSYFNNTSVMQITIISALMFFMCGMIFPMSVGKGLALFRHIAGTATATMYLINILITSLMAFLTGFIKLHSIVSMAWMYLVLNIIIMVTYWGILRRSQ